MDRAKLEKCIQTLSDMHGASGFEKDVAIKVSEMFAPYADEIYTDALGSVIVHQKASSGGKVKIMLDAHIDEIGLIVTKIDERGFLKFTNIGGIDERILPAQEVVVHGKKDVYGVIGIKPPHLQSADDSDKTIKIEELAIDIGMSKEEAEKWIEAGNSVTFMKSASPMKNSQLTGKSLDDRASVGALLHAAELLYNDRADADVYFVLSVREEVNLSGAKCAAYKIEPDCALVIDVTHSKTPDNSSCAFETGKGVSYSIGPNVHKELSNLVKTIADNKGIEARAEVDGGSTGTNAWSVQVSRTGVACAVMSLPLKYMHTPTEVVSVGDVYSAGEIAAEFVKRVANGAVNTFAYEIR